MTKSHVLRSNGCPLPFVIALSFWALGTVCFAADGLAPWGSNHHPSDLAKRHSQDITTNGEYSVIQGGTMDGQNTRSPQGVWQPFEQTWESNRSVRMENIGESDVVNPWLATRRSSFRSVPEIVSAAANAGMSEKDKAMALWWQQIQHRFHHGGDNNELMDLSLIHISEPT